MTEIILTAIVLALMFAIAWAGRSIDTADRRKYSCGTRRVEPPHYIRHGGCRGKCDL